MRACLKNEIFVENRVSIMAHLNVAQPLLPLGPRKTKFAPKGLLLIFTTPGEAAIYSWTFIDVFQYFKSFTFVGTFYWK